MPRVITIESVNRQIARLQAQARALEAAQGQKKTRDVERVRALMKKLGVELSDLNAGSGVRAARLSKAMPPDRKALQKDKKKKVLRKASGSAGKLPPKYRNPETGELWTGRGRTPLWLAEKISNGATKEDFLIAAVAPLAVSGPASESGESESGEVVAAD